MNRAIVGLDDNVNEEMTYKCNTRAEEDENENKSDDVRQRQDAVQNTNDETGQMEQEQCDIINRSGDAVRDTNANQCRTSQEQSWVSL